MPQKSTSVATQITPPKVANHSFPLKVQENENDEPNLKVRKEESLKKKKYLFVSMSWEMHLHAARMNAVREKHLRHKGQREK